MTLQANMRRLADEVWWRARGVFAREDLRNLGFQARSLWQRDEMCARANAARLLSPEVNTGLEVPDHDGFKLLPGDLLPDLSEICAIGRERAAALLSARARSTGTKEFHRNKVASEADQRMLLRLALDRRVLAMVTDYLGVLPVLGDLDYFMSVPSKPPWKKSQLWHCDDDSPRQLKLFVYCDDTDDATGPFELIGASDSHAARRSVGYRYAGKRYRISDEEMDKFVPRAAQRTITGARGTAFVVDTVRCFHKGSRVTGDDRHRMVAVILYCTPNGMKMPLRLAARPGPYAHLAGPAMSNLERAVLGHPLA